MATVKHWTPEEDNYLKECVETYPTLTKAFEMASKRIERSPKAIMQHYYKHNKKHVLTLYKEGRHETAFLKLVSFVRNIFTF